ncbi:hypothetical protein [Saccharopolyspora phatthalungensis]|uniref:Glycine zipper domain-containing protein n=1 Tax=Saccharopolyspora phatthalungensis TaxID=664693 RepID=A0A840Q5Y8_9PSEU|nr:hypothetical protein [Saccharopolyspora phatthalungensis]MBB5154089.1 hypothetical protein [Saccharopolyspora phatthalungensis]
MSLDTEVKGDPDSLTAVYDWAYRQSDGVEEAARQIQLASAESEAGWKGAAADGFRAVLIAVGKMADTEVRALQDTCRELQTHADDLRTVKAMMQRAQDVAALGGLVVHGFTIEEPGPAPPDPKPLPEGRQGTPAEQQEHAAAVQAQAAFDRKAMAYAQASQIVKEARDKESQSQHILVRFLSGVLDPVKLSLTLTDISCGVIGATAVRMSKYRRLAEDAMSKAERAAKLTTSQNLSIANRSKAAAIQITNELRAKEAMDQAVATRASRVIGRFPPRVQDQLERLDRKLVPKSVKTANPYLKGSVRFGKIVPGLGIIATGLGIGYDIGQGKDPTIAVASGTASLVSGAIIGAAIGGPPGAIAGGIVGVGVGFTVDELGDEMINLGKKLEEINPKMTR